MKRIMSLALIALLGQSFVQATGLGQSIQLAIPDYLKDEVRKTEAAYEKYNKASKKQRLLEFATIAGCAALGGLISYIYGPREDKEFLTAFVAYLSAHIGTVPGALLSDIYWANYVEPLQSNAGNVKDELLRSCQNEQDRELVRTVLRKNGIQLAKKIYV